MKVFYLCYYVAVGIYFPYVGLYLGAIHLSGTEIGLVASVTPLAGLLMQPVWGLLSDRFGWRKQLLMAALLVVAAIAPFVVFARSFAVLLALMIVLAVALSPIAPLADATTLEVLRRKKGRSYGGVRIYGSLGFLISSLSIGPIFNGRGIFLLFPLFGAFQFVTFLASLAVPRPSTGVALAHEDGIGTVLRDRGMLPFLLFAFLGYGTFAAYNTFFGLYLRGLGAGTGLVGLAAGLASCSELPVMALAGYIMHRAGVKPLLLCGLGAATIRWLAYGLVHDYRLALPFQLLHGLAFAGFYVAGVTFVDRSVPAHLRATGQTIFNGATFGLGSFVGSNVFGFLYDRLHAGGMYLTAGVLCAIAIAGLYVVMPDPAAEPPPAPNDP